MKVVETSRLLLRYQVLDDLESLLALYSDPEVIRYIPDAPRTYAETKAELMWHRNGHPDHPELGLWATIHKETNEFIGRCGLLPWTINGQAEVEVAYLIHKAYWGQGLGTEAAQAVLEYGFENLNLTRLICLIDKENVASRRVAEKIGMQFESTGADEMGPYLLYAINK